MANTYKVLGQSNPTAATSTTLYTCPASTQTVVSSIIVCNRSSVATSFRVSIDVNGAGDSNEDYIAYDVPIEGNETIALGHGVTIDASDLIRCYATLATLTFSVFGQEIA
jgi:hypothetical protein